MQVQNTLQHCIFIKKVSQGLLENYLKNNHLEKSLREGIARLLPKVAVTTTITSSQSFQCWAKRCEFCDRSRDQKVKTVCGTCRKYVCSDHSKCDIHTL